MTRSLVIIGAGGHAREVLDIVEAINEAEPESWNVLGILASGEQFPERAKRRGVEILGPISELNSLDAFYVIGIGSPKVRSEIDRQFLDKQAAILQHPRATIGADVEFEPGCVVAAGAVITTNVRFGRHSHVNVNASVSHDCNIGSYAIIGPGSRVAGNVIIGDRVDVGIGVTIAPNLTIGNDAVIGSGANVIREVSPSSTVVGNPASPIRQNDAQD